MKGNLSVSMVAIALVAALAGPVQLAAQIREPDSVQGALDRGG